MAADLTIVNLSLANLGQNVLTQTELTANGKPSAVAANLWWDPCFKEVMGANNWSFATVTASLAALDIEDFEWDYVYSYPAVTLAMSSMWTVYNDATVNSKDSQEFCVKYVPTLGVTAIFSNLQYACAEYTYKVTDTSLWTSNFITAFSYRLAAAMAISITGAGDKGVAAGQTYNSLISDAKRLSFSEKKKTESVANKYIDCR